MGAVQNRFDARISWSLGLFPSIALMRGIDTVMICRDHKALNGAQHPT